MPTVPCALSSFVIKRPPFETHQEHTLDWIAASHLQAEKKKSNLSEECCLQFKKNLEARLKKVACKTQHIKTRGHVMPDIMHQNWADMHIYRLHEGDTPAMLSERQIYHRTFVDKVFEDLYENPVHLPQDLIHVSCTGYASPSGAQKIVSKNNWSLNTTVTHLYHMGCYASIPAVRVGSSFIHQNSKKVDIVHTELCTLHYCPERHNDEDLVVQSLFSDGFIKYSIQNEDDLRGENKPYFSLLGFHEEQIPHTEQKMEWLLEESGFRFALSKEIPLLIAKNIKGFVSRLKSKAQITEDQRPLYFAIHPGGPKILDHCIKILDIKKENAQISYEILSQYGNMSSATLPHVWEKMLHSKDLPDNALILSIAVGPGLTIAGLVLNKKI